MAEWFSSLASQALKLADDLADSFVTQANEAQTQLLNEQKKLEQEESERQKVLHEKHLLPWDTNIESRQILSRDLMEKVLNLSVQEKNFTVRSANAEEVKFYFQEFIPIAMELLQLDTNLARMHARLSPKMLEEEFWFNFYCRVVYLRARSGIDGPDALHASSQWKESDIIMENSLSLHRAASESPSLPSLVRTDKASISNFDSAGKESGPQHSPLQLDISDDINLEDLDIDMENLDLLDEIGEEDYDQIGTSTNDELEAQIAQELADADDT